MNKIRIKKILDLYLDGGLTPHLEDVVKGWMCVRKEDFTYESSMGDYFRSHAVPRKPTPGTYRRFGKLCTRLGIQRWTAIKIPFSRQTPSNGRDKITDPVEYVLETIKVFESGFKYHYDGSGIKVEMEEAYEV